jgi:uncharacterized protein
MKASPYNHFFELLDGQVILAYNTFSGKVAEIEPENYAAVQNLLNNPERSRDAQSEEFYRCLCEGGFLIPGGVDQTAALRVNSRTARLKGSTLTLTIAPTLACNFACDYCFEARSNELMSKETQAALLSFVDRQLSRCSGLRICWFGGEPTLCLPIIERLHNQLRALTEKHHAILHPAYIITNGYLMNAAMATRLHELGVTRAQVTLDGPEAVHDRRRKLRNGKGTFRRIIENLRETADIISISLRINIDRDNVDTACEVAEILKQNGLLDKVKVSFAQITASDSICSDVRDRCQESSEFAVVLEKIYRKFHESGIHQIDLPRLSPEGACGAVSEGYYVISPNGLLFKCWEDLSVNGEKSIGTVLSPELNEKQKANLESYRAWQPLALEGCRACSVLPICMGGCPARGRELINPIKGACATWKYNLKEMLELAYLAANRPSEQHGDS